LYTPNSLIGPINRAINYCKKGFQPKSEWFDLHEKGPKFGLNAEVVEIGHKPIDKTDILNSNLMQGQWHKLKSKIINNENIINDKDNPRSQTALLENQVFDLLKNVENELTIKELSIEHPALYYE